MVFNPQTIIFYYLEEKGWNENYGFLGKNIVSPYIISFIT